MRFCFFLQRHDMPKPLACLLVPLFVRVLPTCFSSPASGTSRARTNFDISCPLITMMLKLCFMECSFTYNPAEPLQLQKKRLVAGVSWAG